MKPISSNFATELKAADLLGLPFTWSPQGELELSALTPVQRDAVLAVVAAHDPLIGVKNDRCAAVNAKRDALQLSGFPFSGKWIDSHGNAVLRINVAVQAAIAAKVAGVPFAVSWTCADNSEMPLNADAMLAMNAALAAHGAAIHNAARGHKQAIGALTTAEAVQAYNIEAGWPV